MLSGSEACMSTTSALPTEVWGKFKNAARSELALSRQELLGARAAFEALAQKRRIDVSQLPTDQAHGAGAFLAWFRASAKQLAQHATAGEELAAPWGQFKNAARAGLLPGRPAGLSRVEAQGAWLAHVAKISGAELRESLSPEAAAGAEAYHGFLEGKVAAPPAGTVVREAVDETAATDRIDVALER